MNASLGPRTIYWVSPSGENGEISMTIYSQPSQPAFIEGELISPGLNGTISVSSTWFTRTLRAQAEDEIQLVFRLLWAADIYTQKICQENGYKIHKHMKGDVREVVGWPGSSFGIYS